MRKLLLSFSALSLLSWNVSAQCTPDASLITGAFGVYPDTVINFSVAEINSPYSQVLQFKAPSDAGEIDPNFAGQIIQSFTVTGVDGMPPGLSYACNITSCQYAGGSGGCAAITGTPTALGTFDITINITAVVLVTIIPGTPPTPVDVPRSFDGYKISVVAQGSSSIDALSQSSLSIFPNPVQGQLTLNNLKDFSGLDYVNILNIEGKIVQSFLGQQDDKLEVNTADLNAGIYFIEVQHANGVERKKFIKE